MTTILNLDCDKYHCFLELQFIIQFPKPPKPTINRKTKSSSCFTFFSSKFSYKYGPRPKCKVWVACRVWYLPPPPINPFAFPGQQYLHFLSLSLNTCNKHEKLVYVFVQGARKFVTLQIFKKLNNWEIHKTNPERETINSKS